MRSSKIHSIQSAKLVGFCNASSKVYTAFAYLKLEREAHQVSVKFIVGKTQVAPVGRVTIAQLELLSALILSRLIDSIHAALESEIQVGDSACSSKAYTALAYRNRVSAHNGAGGAFAPPLF